MTAIRRSTPENAKNPPVLAVSSIRSSAATMGSPVTARRCLTQALAYPVVAAIPVPIAVPPIFTV